MTRFQKACLQVKRRNTKTLNHTETKPVMDQADRFASFINEAISQWKAKRAKARQEKAQAEINLMTSIAQIHERKRADSYFDFNQRLEQHLAKERAEKIRVIRNQILTSYYGQTSTDWVTSQGLPDLEVQTLVHRAHVLADQIYKSGVNLEKALSISTS